MSHNTVLPSFRTPHIHWDARASTLSVVLQDGPIQEVGVNGVQVDDVVLWCRDLIKAFNERFPCRENSLTITKLEEALLWLKARKDDRLQRGVEGLDKP